MSDRLSSDLASLRIDRDREDVPVAPPAAYVPPSAGRGIIVKTMLATVAIGILIAGGVLGVREFRGAMDKIEVDITEVSLVTAAQSSVELSGAGHAVPQELVKLAPKYAGRIAMVNVREGAVVSKGGVLFILDAEAKRNAVISAGSKAAAASARAGSARATLNTLQRRLSREQKLAASGAVSRAGVDDLQDQVESARASYAAASADAMALATEKKTLENDLSDVNIDSPINGRAISKPMAAGDMAAPDKVLVELADFESMAIEVDVAETRLEQVKVGTPCEVVLDAYPSKRFRGQVFQINPRIDRAKATGTVKVKMIDGVDVVLPGMSARVNFLSRPLAIGELGEPAKKVIPADAVAERNHMKVAFLIENGHAHEIPLVLGGPAAGGFEVKEGPPVGAHLIRSPPASLTNGQTVQEKVQK
jgi:RND family efflux transporter MFP subunit